MDLYIPGHDPSTIDGGLSIQIMDNTLYHPLTRYPGSPRNQRGTAPSNRSRDNSHRDVYDEVYGGGVQNAPAAPPRGWRTTTATPTSLVGLIASHSSYSCNLAHKKPHRERHLPAYVYPNVIPSNADNFARIKKLKFKNQVPGSCSMPSLCEIPTPTTKLSS